ncbi:MAG: hybrid sensor histidine kinase/response regulator [Pseudomonadota bacterium]
MDDLLSEFLTETAESLDVVDVELVKFEQDPNNAEMLDNIFRLVHTIKGTCGFLGLPRLESLAHAGETLMGKFRDGVPVTQDAVTLILQSIDRIKEILEGLESEGTEPEGSDEDLISELEHMALGGGAEAAADPVEDVKPDDEDEPPLVVQALERELKPGEVTLDELEQAFLNTPGPEDFETVAETVAPQKDAATDRGLEAEAAAEVATEAAMDAAMVEAEPEVVAPKAAPKPPVAKAEPAKPEGQKTEGGVKNQSIRVNVDTLEHLMTTVSELVLTRNQLLEIVRRHEDSEFKVPLQRLSNVTAELQEGVMQTRMQPIGNAWQKLPRIIRDLANELDKKIELEMSGAETELDRQVLDLIKDPLTHMVRNSADHGLETRQGRIDAGKSEIGTVRLSAYHEGGHIIIQIADDGRGIDVDKVRQKAIERGIATEDELDKMTENQIQKFIFDAGFSTAAAVTNVSGRGVGMDVVRTNIELIGGSVDLKSVRGEGSTFTIKIPLTLAIVSALIVEAAEQRFAIPQLNVVELVRAQSNSEHRIETIKDTPVLRLRSKLLPLIHMSRVLGLDSSTDMDEAKSAEEGFIVVAQVGPLQFGIIVDGVFHTEEIVVKPMSSMLRDIPMFSGNTILGDGSVIMIIDPNGIAQAIGTGLNSELEALEADDMARVQGDSKSVSMLLFRAGSPEPKAVPLSLVTRLEEVSVEEIEHVNGRDMVQYRGTLMPLIYVSESATRKTEGQQPLLVFSDQDHAMGLVVDDIVDIVDEPLNIEIASDTPGTLGSAIIKGRATEILDTGYFLPLAFEDWFERKEMEAGSSARSVLFVDDSAFFRNMIGPVLKAAGYEADIYEDARDALKALHDGRRYDVIISDIEMPEMTGFEFAEAINRDPALRDIPIIALSSHTAPAAISRGRQVGFFDFVAKFDREGLIAALKDAATPMQEAA